MSGAYQDVFTAVIRRFIRLVGEPAALRIARRVPGLVVAEDGQVLSFDESDPTGTLNLLIDSFEVVFGDIALTLSKQAAEPIAARVEPTLAELFGTSPPPVARLVLVDDHALFRSGIASVFDGQRDLQLVGQAGSVKDAIDLVTSLKPDLALLDFNLPDGTGLDALRGFRAAGSEVKTLFLTVYEDDEHLFSALRAGAVGYLPKNVRASDLLSRVRAVLAGEIGLLPAVAVRILKEFTGAPVAAGSESALPALTSRETEVVSALAHGATNREIARRFVISENTVKNHIRNVLTKLQLRNRREIVNYARRRGLS